MEQAQQELTKIGPLSDEVISLINALERQIG